MPQCTIGTHQYVSYRARLGVPVQTEIENFGSDKNYFLVSLPKATKIKEDVSNHEGLSNKVPRP